MHAPPNPSLDRHQRLPLVRACRHGSGPNPSALLDGDPSKWPAAAARPPTRSCPARGVPCLEREPRGARRLEAFLPWMSASSLDAASGCGTRSIAPFRSKSLRLRSASSGRSRACARVAQIRSAQTRDGAENAELSHRRPLGRRMSSYSCVTAGSPCGAWCRHTGQPLASGPVIRRAPRPSMPPMLLAMAPPHKQLYASTYTPPRGALGWESASRWPTSKKQTVRTRLLRNRQ